MTPEERAATLGDVIETLRGDANVEVWRSDVAEAIREAVLDAYEECEKIAEDYDCGKGADAIRERADAVRKTPPA